MKYLNRMIIDEIKGTFIPPVKKYYLGRLQFGTPYMYPRKFNSTIFTIRKVKLKYCRNLNFNLFGYNISYGSPIWIHKNDLGWKDKFNTPRFEWSPAFIIFFFKWQFCIFWNSPIDNSYKYWEMILWWLYYSDKDIKKAESTWKWTNGDNSTWNSDIVNSTMVKRNNTIKEILK